MISLNNYILEKLKINKNIINDFSNQLVDNIMNFIKSDNKNYYSKILDWIKLNKVSEVKAYISTKDYDNNLKDSDKELFNFIRNEISYEWIKNQYKDDENKKKTGLLITQRNPAILIWISDNILKIYLQRFAHSIYLEKVNEKN